jgi:hypothetical protein
LWVLIPEGAAQLVKDIWKDATNSSRELHDPFGPRFLFLS